MTCARCDCLLTNIRMRTEAQNSNDITGCLVAAAARNLMSFYNRELAPLGLTAPQALSLGVLYAEDGLSLGEFARRAGVGKAAAATMIQRLETQGLVTRDPDPTDARLNAIRLTPKAQDFLPRLGEKMLEVEKKLEEAVGPAGLEKLKETLTSIIDLQL